MPSPPRSGLAVGAAGLLACATLALGLGACGGDDPEPVGDVPLNLVIGDSLPLSGELAAYGPAGRKAAALAEKQIEAAAAATGARHTVRVLTRNNATNPATAVTTARQMADAGATCITGAWASTDTLEIAKAVAIPERLLQISPASTATELTELDDDGFLLRTSPPDALEGRALAQAIADDLGGTEDRTVNIGARDDDYGESVGGAFADAWRELGGIVGEDVSYDTGTEPDPEDPEAPPYAEAAEQITEGDPDAIVIADFPETFAELAPALEGTGAWDPGRAWAPAALASPSLAELAGSASVEGIRGTTPAAPDDGDASVAFDRLYDRSAPRSVRRALFDAHLFDATILCYLAAVGAGSTDGEEMSDALIDLTAPEGSEYDWRELPAAIAAVTEGEDINYTGASGPIDMDENGDPTAGSFDIYRHTGGTVKVIGQVQVDQ